MKFSEEFSEIIHQISIQNLEKTIKFIDSLSVDESYNCDFCVTENPKRLRHLYMCFELFLGMYVHVEYEKIQKTCLSCANYMLRISYFRISEVIQNRDAMITSINARI
jgi:hypothetical protein